MIWPSRLKVGAKSKKGMRISIEYYTFYLFRHSQSFVFLLILDPHIRVGGVEECVRRAKGRIMEYLSTKSNRVTMKMDVSYTDHSHVIGKGGDAKGIRASSLSDHMLIFFHSIFSNSL